MCWLHRVGLNAQTGAIGGAAGITLPAMLAFTAGSNSMCLSMLMLRAIAELTALDA